jgi:FolB domain-containing protein
MALDKIIIEDLLVRVILGINPEERIHKQDVIITMTLFADLTAAGRSDAIEDTINYKQLKLDVIDHVENSQCLLIERLVQEIADLILKERRVKKCIVKVEKPTALRFCKTVAVEIEREQSC